MSAATSVSLTPDEAGRVFTTPASYADDRLFHEACTVLRAADPVHLVRQDPQFAPFWAVTKHADIMEIEGKPDLFTNAPFPVLGNLESQAHARTQGEMLRTLIHMDAPDHRVIRNVTAEWFLPATWRGCRAGWRRWPPPRSTACATSTAAATSLATWR
jgi:cytochrome P450